MSAGRINSLLKGIVVFKVFFCSNFSSPGGWRLKVESRLTLKKEDTTSYYVYKFVKDRVSDVTVNQYHTLHVISSTAVHLYFLVFLFKVMGQTGKLDLTKNREEKFGNTNNAFCNIELT